MLAVFFHAFCSPLNDRIANTSTRSLLISVQEFTIMATSRSFVLGFLAYTEFFNTSQRKKSEGVTSGERESYSVASTSWCDPRPCLGWVEMAVGLPEGPSYPGHSPSFFCHAAP